MASMPGMPASSMRCSLCGENWPPSTDYQVCPECGERTSPFAMATPTMTAEEAKSRKAHADFDRWCEENDRV